MFQPGEEGHHGARYMLDEGLLDVPALADGTASPVEAAAAIHVTSVLPTGVVTTRGGPIMASADRIEITVTGRRRHASEPFRALDPVPIACEIVQAIQTMVTRRVDVFDPAVVTVGFDPRWHDEQRDPRDGAHRRHSAHDLRADAKQGARRAAAPRRRHRRRPRGRGLAWRSSRATR